MFSIDSMFSVALKVDTEEANPRDLSVSVSLSQWCLLALALQTEQNSNSVVVH